MPFFIFLPVAILVEELIQVAVVATVVAVGVRATEQVAQTTVDVVHRGVEAVRDLNAPSSTSTRTTCFEQKTIWDWWGNGLTGEERQTLLEHGYSDRTGCFTLEKLRSTLDDICFQKTKEKAPGKPTENVGYKPGKVGNEKDNLVKNPNGPGKGWLDKKGKVWVPTGDDGHGGAHWDVQDPVTGGHEDVYPDGTVRRH